MDTDNKQKFLYADGQLIGGQSVGRDITDRKPMEEALFNGEIDFKDIIYESPIPQFVINKNHRIVHWNKALEETTGIKASEVTGTNQHWRAFYNTDRPCIADVLVDGDIERMKEEYRDKYGNFKLTGGGCEAMDYFPALGKDGRWLYITVLTIKNADGQVAGALETLQDITEQKKSEELLRQSEERYRLITENANDTIWTIDLSGKVTYMSPSVKRLLGYTPEEAMAHGLDQVMTPASLTAAMNNTKEIISQATAGEHPKNRHVELEFIRKDGSKVWIEVASNGMFDASGRLVGIEGMTRDITERKKAQEESDTQMRYAALSAEIAVEVTRGDDLMIMLRRCSEAIVHCLDLTFVRIWTLAKDENILELRASAGMYTHIDGQHGRVPVGKSIIGIIAQEKKPFVVNNVIGDINIIDREWAEREQMVAFAGYPLVVEDKLVGVMAIFSREPFDEKILITLTSVANGIAIGTLRKWTEAELSRLNEELKQNIVQLVNAQEELVRKEKLSILGQLAGIVGHEIRNPLGVMSNAVYFLKTLMPDANDTVREYLDIIKQEINNSLRIITDLLDFARTRSPKAQPVAIASLINQGIKKCLIPENISVDIEIPETLPQLLVDPAQMEQVLQNLIANAVQAMPEGGTLNVTARRVQGSRLKVQGYEEKNIEQETSNSQGGIESDSEFVEITVSDTGGGISPENMKKLFQPLFTTKTKGIGLGLVVCKNLVEANGGNITVESQIGRGTILKLEFPIVKDNS